MNPSESISQDETGAGLRRAAGVGAAWMFLLSKCDFPESVSFAPHCLRLDPSSPRPSEHEEEAPIRAMAL